MLRSPSPSYTQLHSTHKYSSIHNQLTPPLLDRGPPHRTGENAFDTFFTSLPPSASASLSHVRLFTQMYWLESGHNLLTCLSHPNFHASTLTITIRYSDWWNWEDNAPLTMNIAWLRRFRGNPELREMRVEYETLSWKREEMMRIVERNKGVEVGVGGGEGYLSARGTGLEEWRWRGTSRVGGRTWGHHGGGETVEYVVVRDRWRWVEGEMEGSGEWDSDEEEEEVYSEEEDGDWSGEDGEEEEGEDDENESGEEEEGESEGQSGAESVTGRGDQ